jgi:ABC-type branched-subunit amino acid transport system substrate-binding protein
MTLVAAACGARLSPRQLAIANGSDNGVMVGSSSGSASTGGSGYASPSSGLSSGNAGSGANANSPTGLANSLTGGGSGNTSGTNVASGSHSSAGTSSSSSSSSGGGASTGGSGASGGVSSTSLAVGGKVCPSGGAASSPGVTSSTITIGNVSTLTGPIPGLFLGAQQGTQAFVTYINNTGGVCGRKLVLKSADDNLDPSQNATAVQSLAGSVLAFVGSFSVADQGGASVLASDGVPDIGEALSSQRFNLSNNFSPQPQPVGWTTAPFEYFAQRFGPSVTQHMAVFAEDQSTALAQGLAEEAALKAIGYKFVLSDTTIQPTQTDFSAEVNEMQADGVKGLIFQATAQIYGDMAKDMYAAGYSVPFADWGPTAYDPAFITTGGPGANGAVLYSEEAMYEGEDAASVPEIGLFDQYYEALYHEPPDLYAAFGWMSGMLFVEALNAGGAPTRSALLNGLGSITSFDANGMVATGNPAGKKPPTCYIVIDVVNGKFVRDSADPPAGFRCTPASPFYYGS